MISFWNGKAKGIQPIMTAQKNIGDALEQHMGWNKRGLLSPPPTSTLEKKKY